MIINYDNSLLSLISSILNYYNAKASHPTLPDIDILLKKNYKNVVVMLFDGMSMEIINQHLPQNSFFHNHFVRNISSVFPPTTTAATVTMESGLSPIEHGWLGWSLYFNEIDSNVNIFPNTLSGTDGILAADYNIARKYIGYTDVFEKINRAGKATANYVSQFSSYHSKSVSDICETIIELCKENGQQYIYSYWHQPDYDIHNYGTKHEKITEHIKEINQLVEDMCNQLEDTLIIITADHGLIDTTWRFITNYPDIEECLLRKPSIESRALTFFIKENMKEQFEKAFRKYFGDVYSLYNKEQIIKRKFFGEGTPHSKSYCFIGDYLAVATSNVSIESAPSANHEVFKAAHAGFTKEEMNVPLIIVEK